MRTFDMRSMLGFSSLFALGLVIAGGYAVIGPGIGWEAGAVDAAVGTSERMLDARSLFVGLAIGLGLAFATRVAWSELPRRAIAWLMSNERTLQHLGWAAVLLAVVLLY